MNRILHVDDEARIREVAEYALAREGCEVVSAADGVAALARVEAGGVDLVVLDVMMPGLDGLAVVRRLRARRDALRTLPVLFLSARGEELDRVLGLDLGGDDYLVKPFSPRELVARVRALLRRAGRDEAGGRTIEVGALRLDLDRWETFAGGQPVEMTRTELLLLAALLERPGVVLSRAQLVRRVYPYDNLVTERTIDTHVRRIRAKLRPFALDPIGTVHGVGYKASDG
jgi:two-component system OmpR family response regulator